MLDSHHRCSSVVASQRHLPPQGEKESRPYSAATRFGSTQLGRTKWQV